MSDAKNPRSTNHRMYIQIWRSDLCYLDGKKASLISMPNDISILAFEEARGD
jgi:hypothetical protein